MVWHQTASRGATLDATKTPIGADQTAPRPRTVTVTVTVTIVHNINVR